MDVVFNNLATQYLNERQEKNKHISIHNLLIHINRNTH